MSSQGSLFRPGTANREEAVPVQARLLARESDPLTSKAAANKMVELGKLTHHQSWAYEYLRDFGPGTTHELARQALYYYDRDDIHYKLARRLPELERKGLVRVQQDPSKPCRCKPNATRCRCRDVVREGSRCWEAMP